MIAALPLQAGKRIRSLLQSVPLDAPLVAGISGGRDSMLLLRLLKEHGFERIIVAHLNHSLRGEFADADAEFVENAAKKMGCTFVGKKIPPPCNENGTGIEEQARLARRDFFAHVAAETGAEVLFLGHHADDRVETFLHHLLRGTGTRGMSSLRAETFATMENGSLRVLRPLIWLHRAQIDALTEKFDIVSREDHTNMDPTFTRNRMRHEILPFLEKSYGREVRHALARTAAILEAEDDFLEDLAVSSGVVRSKLEVKELQTLPLALQRRVLRAWLQHHSIANVGFDVVESLHDLLTQSSPAKVNLPGDMHVRRRAGKLFIEKPE